MISSLKSAEQLSRIKKQTNKQTMRPKKTTTLMDGTQFCLGVTKNETER